MHDRFIFISTLDGKLTALNTANGGTEAWKLSTEPGALLSSTIGQPEVKKKRILINNLNDLLYV